MIDISVISVTGNSVWMYLRKCAERRQQSE